MTKPLSFEKGVLKFNFKPKFFYAEFNIWGWNPVELINYCKSLPAFKKYAEQHKAKNMYRYEELPSEEVDGAYATYCSGNYYLKVKDEYVDCEEEFMQYLHRSGRVIIPVIRPVEVIIENTSKVSGKKRKLKDISNE